MAERENPMHLEVFAPGVVLPCWCAIARAHTHEEWVEHGGPSHTGRPDELDASQPLLN